MLYPLIKPILFFLDPETAHNVSLALLRALGPFGLSKLLAKKCSDLPVNVMGLNFKNPVGLAAGFDKSGDYIDALAQFGFGFIELGTVTPRPQPGNPRPRIFRLPKAKAVINRLGFNNKGVDYLVKQIAKANYKGIIGVNIGKNFDTPIERAVEDYLHCMKKVYQCASYITINISSPNTKQLRELQTKEHLKALIDALTNEREILKKQFNKYTPLAIKIAPDLSEDQLKDIAEVINNSSIDAVIATNTTISRDGIAGHRYAIEQGGLSGAPLKRKSDHVLTMLHSLLQGQKPIIGVGGIMCANDALEKINAGAKLVQVYTGLIYRGPGLVRETVEALR